MRKKFLLMTFLTLLFTAMGTSVLRAQGVEVSSYSELLNAVNDATVESIVVSENANITIPSGGDVRVCCALTNNGTITGEGRLIVSTMVYVVSTENPYGDVYYDKKATKNGSITGNIPSNIAYEISLDGGNTWFTDINNGTSEAVTVKKTDGTVVCNAKFQSAFTSAQTGDIVHMLKDAHVQSTNPKKNNGPLRSYYGLVLEGNGHTIFTDLESSGASNEYATIKFTSYLAGTGPEVNPILKNVTIDSQKNAKADLDYVSGDVTFTVTMYNVNLLGNCQYASFAMTSPSMIINKSNVEFYDVDLPSWDASSANEIDIYSGEYELTLNSKCTVYGGTFDRDVTAYLADGVAMEYDEETGTYVAVISPVAKIGEVEYTDLQEAIVAAAPDGTVEILSDVTVDEWIMISETLNVGSGQIITMNINGLTINGNGKTVTINSIESAGNGNRLFYDATKLNINNWTIKYADGVAGGIGLTSGTIEGVTFDGGTYGVFPGANGVTIENCTFNGTKSSAVYYEEGRQGIVVKNNIFNTADGAYAIIMRSNEQFTGNIINKGRVNIANSSSATVTGNNFGQERFKVYNAATATIENNEINVLAFNDNSVVFSTFGVNTLSTEAQAVLDGASFPVAQIGETKYGTLEAAFEAATEGQTITLLADATPALTSQRAITKAAVIDLGGKTLTLTEDDLYFGTTEFKNGSIIVDQSVKPSTAVFWMFANQTLTFDNVKIVATGVTGTYLIGLDGNNSDLNLLNGSEIVVENTTALDLDIICVNASTGNDIKVENSKVNVTNLDGRVFFRGNYTVKDSEVNLAGITKAGFRIEAGQTLSIEGTSVVNITGELRDGGIHLTDLTATYTVAETATVNATVNQPVAVAQIGTTKYGTLQEAIDDVQNGETIELLSDVTENVTLTEKTDLYYTINGSDKTMNGKITVNSLSDTNDNRRITIKNIKFVDNTDANVDFISSVETNHYPRLTISGCDFTGSGNDGDVAIRLKSSHSVVIENCTGIGLHSFLQNTSGWNLTINNVTVTNSKSGLALGTVQGVTVIGSNIDVNGYGIRLDAQYNNSAVIESNAVEAFIPVVVRRAEVVSSITFSGTNTMTASNTDGLWCAIGTSEYETNGTMPTAPTGQVTVTLNDTGLSMDGVYGAFFPVKIGETGYATLAAAAAAAQAGDEIILLADVTEDVTLPAGITLNGNGKAVGNIIAAGTITFNGHTKATSFNVKNTNTTVNIVEGACLEITGTDRMVIGHGCTFNITGTITDAKNANVADLTPSLIMPGASFTGAGVTFNVTNAYISAPSSYCSSSKSASGTFDFNITNSIWDSANKLAFEAQSTAATVNFELVNSVLNTGSHLVFGVSRGEVVIDNSNVNVGTSRQIENQSTMTVKNGSVVNGAVATSSNAKNPGTLIVDNATYAVTGEFSGSDLGTGTLIVNKNANFSAGSITKANIQIDATGMKAGDEVNITAGLANHAGTIEVINDNMLDAKIVDGKIVIVDRTLQGEGTEASPYVITNLDDLKFFRDHVNEGNTYAGKYIKVTATEIDLNNEEWTPIAYMGKTFKGNFDGNNVTVKNLKITKALTNSAENNGIGFFGSTGAESPATIENIIIENVDITGSLYVGAIVGYGYTGKHVKGCTVKGDITIDAWWYAGVIGGNGYMNLIDNCHVIGNDGSYIKGNDGSYIGGIWGFRGEGNNKITNCTVENLDIIGVDRVGGICGIGHYGNTISGCDAEDVTVTATDPEATTIGLLVGATQGNVNGPTIFEDNDASGITAQIDNGDGTYTEVTNLYGTNIDGGVAVTNYVAQIVGGTQYPTLAEAVAAAVNNDVITLLPTPTNAPIAMNASLYGKDVTITGTATVDWSKGFLFVGRGGAGNAILTFDNANLTSASDNASTGIHVSGREKGTNDKYDGTLVINNSTIELDYLINKGTMTLDNSTLTVKNGFSVGGRPASETESGQDATATITLNNNSKVVVNNHNGMGLGYEAIGVMDINSGSTFETTQSFLITAKGTMNVNGGNVKTVGTLTNNGAVNVTGESILDIETLTENEIDFLDGAIIKNSTVGGGVFVAGKVTFRGDNTFAMLYDYGTLTGYYGTTANMEWTVEEGASLTLTDKARYGLGYGDNVTINGSITDALEARENLTEDDRSLFMHGLVAQESSGWNCNSKLTVKNAYVVLGSNNSFGNKPGNYGGNYTFNFNNSVVDGSRITFYEALSTTEFTFEDSDVKIGTFMTRDTDSKFTLKNSKVLSTATGNGTDEGNYNAGELTLDKSSLTYRAEFANTGTLNIGESSTFTAPSVVNNGAINFTALSAKLDTDTEGLTIVDQVNNPDYKVVYKEGAYQFVEKVYVAQIGENKYESLQEAVEAVLEDETIVLLGDITFTTGANGSTNGISYTRGVNFTLDLSGKTITSDLGGNALRFKIGDGNDITNTEVTINVKNGKVVSGSNNWCAISAAVAENSNNKLTMNLTNLVVEANKAGDFAIKSWAGAVVNTNNVDVISSYAGGFYACGGEIVLDENSSVNQEGLHTQPYMSYAFGVSSNGKMTINGGTYSAVPAAATDANNQGTSHGSAVGGVMSSGGTLIINGGTFSNDNFGDNSLATAARYLIYADAKGDLQINGGTFNALKGIIDNTTNTGADVATVTLKGGTYSANPKPIYNGDAAIPEGYSVTQLPNGYYTVIQIAGTQTFNMEDAGWYWFSTYIKFDTEGEGLDALKYELDDDASLIKGQYAFTNYLTYNNTSFWTSGNNALTTLSPSQMYMINTTSDNVEVDLTGAFLDYEAVPVTINVVEGWNWIGYPVSEEVNINNAIPNAKQGDVIKSQFDGYAMYYYNYPYNNTTLTGWYGELTTLKPGRGYMYQASEDGEFSYTKGNGNGAKSNTIDYNGKNYWFADATQYPNNMSIVAMLSIDGEIVKGNYEVAAFANGECRGSARPIYIEAIDTYVLYMTIYGDEVEELTFMYYDIEKDTEYELNNVMNYSNDAIVGTLSDPYIFSMNILGIGENSIDNINIYPNPTTTDREINLQATCDKVEVFNALGVKVAEYHNVDTLDALETAGIYVIRITNDNAVKHCRLVVK